MAARALSLDLALAAALRAARARAGITQMVAAVRAGITLHALRRAEMYGAASTRTLAGLARAYGVTIDELRGRPRAASAAGEREP